MASKKAAEQYWLDFFRQYYQLTNTADVIRKPQPSASELIARKVAEWTKSTRL